MRYSDISGKKLVTMVKIYLKLMNNSSYKLTKTFVYEGIPLYKPLITA